MGFARFQNLTIASMLAAAALWSCNEESAPEPEQSAQHMQQPPSPMPAGGGDMMQQLRAACPMVVDGADVEVSDTDEGVVLAFTTQAGDADDLRARVEQMAQMYEMHRGQRGMMWHHMGGQGQGRGGPGTGMGHMTGRGPMPAATATVTEVDRGARLELRPTDVSQLEDLREHVRWHQQRMESGECWMLQSQPPAAKDDGQ